MPGNLSETANLPELPIYQRLLPEPANLPESADLSDTGNLSEPMKLSETANQSMPIKSPESDLDEDAYIFYPELGKYDEDKYLLARRTKKWYV